MEYTHIYLRRNGALLSLAEASALLRTPGAIGSEGFLLLDPSKVTFDRHGRPAWWSGGWVYAHIQYGFLCAGAGGPNSLPLVSLSEL
jgi:hypothetical protein